MRAVGQVPDLLSNLRSSAPTAPWQVGDLPHGAAEPQPKRRLEPAVTGETACPTKNGRGMQRNLWS